MESLIKGEGKLDLNFLIEIFKMSNIRAPLI
jgi:hypothetical protein